MRAILIANARAGQRKKEDFQSFLTETAGDLAAETLWTTESGEASRLASEAISGGQCDTILVAGGDGTVNEVACAALQVEAEKRPAIGIIPMGTCNVLANELGLLSLDQAGLRGTLDAGFKKALDVGKAGDRYFLLMAGFGFDGAAVHKVILPIKGVLGAPAYVLSALAALSEAKPSRVVLEIDDDTVTTEAYMVLFANVSSYAFQQMKLAPFAAMDDGWLDICVFEKARIAKFGFIAQIVKTLAHRHLGDPRVRYYRARRTRLRCDPPMLGQLDGEPFGDTPVTIEIVPKALEFIVPKLG